MNGVPGFAGTGSGLAGGVMIRFERFRRPSRSRRNVISDPWSLMALKVARLANASNAPIEISREGRLTICAPAFSFMEKSLTRTVPETVRRDGFSLKDTVRSPFISPDGTVKFRSRGEYSRY